MSPRRLELFQEQGISPCEDERHAGETPVASRPTPLPGAAQKLVSWKLPRPGSEANCQRYVIVEESHFLIMHRVRAVSLEWHQSPEGQGVLAHLADARTGARRRFGGSMWCNEYM